MAKPASAGLFVMAAITEWSAAGFFAAAQVSCFGFFCGECNGLEASSLVRAVTEWLVLAAAAGAPVVGFSSFNFSGIGGVLWAYWISHDLSC